MSQVFIVVLEKNVLTKKSSFPFLKPALWWRTIGAFIMRNDPTVVWAIKHPVILPDA